MASVAGLGGGDPAMQRLDEGGGAVPSLQLASIGQPCQAFGIMAADGFSRVSDGVPGPRIRMVPASPDQGSITAKAERVLDAVLSLARTGSLMLNNPQLDERVGGGGRSSASRALKKLQAAGWILVEMGDRRRRVHIVGTNLCTGWGEARLGHAPFSKERRGEPASASQSTQSFEPSSQRSELQAEPGQVKPHLQYVRALIVSLEAMPDLGCQYPGWPDDERPRERSLFCNRPTLGRSSYCCDHVTLCAPARPGKGKRAKPS